MSSKAAAILDKIKPRKIIWPILIGIGAAAYLLSEEFDGTALKSIEWSVNAGWWLLMAILLMAVRDIAYMYRLRVLTDKELSWRKSFDVIFLWEFASSVTPSVIGGSAIAIFFVHKEGINTGKSTALVMTTAFLDELFYILTVPVVFMLVASSDLFPVELQKEIFGVILHTRGIFFTGYAFILILTSIIIYGIFFQPRGFKYLLLMLFKLPLLKKWREGAAKTGDEIIITSKELKGKPSKFWLRASLATFFSWSARFMVVNCLIAIPVVAGITLGDHLLIYARQLVMWVILLISPTPGGSGVAEIVFSGFLNQFITDGLSAPMAFLWRLISYYPYLFIGVIILPKWLRRVYAKKLKIED